MGVGGSVLAVNHGVFIIFPLFGLLCRFYGGQVALVDIFFYGVSPNLARLSIHHTELDFRKNFRMADVESLIVPLIETSTGEVKGWV